MDLEALTKRRIAACVQQAQTNAKTHGGDNADAIMDLICAAILITRESGGRPSAAIPQAMPHAIKVVDDFWPKGKLQ